MKAVVLTGGQGTRLLPLTVNTPKPLIPVVNRPFLDHAMHLLHRHGIDDAILTLAYLSESFEQSYGPGPHQGVGVTYMREPEPLGTGGAIRNVEDRLAPGESFFVFNGDVLTDLDLAGMLRFHKDKGSVCTIALTPVEDPSAYGVVDLDENGAISRFTEKPKREEATSNWINAGTYILEPEVLAYIPRGQHHMVERGLFPNLLKEGKALFGFRSESYWMDVGTPTKYLQANEDLLAGLLKSPLLPEGEQLSEGIWAGEGTFVHSEANVTGPVVLGRNCHIEARARLVGPLVLSDGCTVGRDAELERLVAWERVDFGPKTSCHNCVLGAGVRLDEESRVEGEAVVGDGAHVGGGNHLSRGARLWPGIALPDHAISF